MSSTSEHDVKRRKKKKDEKLTACSCCPTASRNPSLALVAASLVFSTVWQKDEGQERGGRGRREDRAHRFRSVLDGLDG